MVTLVYPILNLGCDDCIKEKLIDILTKYYKININIIYQQVYIEALKRRKIEGFNRKKNYLYLYLKIIK